MASSARRDPVRELALLVRVPEPGTTNLGEFVFANAEQLAQALAIDRTQLEAASVFDDEEVAPRLRRLLDLARLRQIQQEVDRRRARSLEAARRLGASVRWTDLGAELDVDLLLGELLADRTRKWVAFTTAEGTATIVPRHLVAATAPLRRIHIDLASWVDPHGLHFRWKGGCGGYRWRSHEVDARFADSILTVPLAPRVVLQVPERRRGGAWLKHILRELGYA